MTWNTILVLKPPLALADFKYLEYDLIPIPFAHRHNSVQYLKYIQKFLISNTSLQRSIIIRALNGSRIQALKTPFYRHLASKFNYHRGR